MTPQLAAAKQLDTSVYRMLADADQLARDRSDSMVPILAVDADGVGDSASQAEHATAEAKQRACSLLESRHAKTARTMRT